MTARGGRFPPSPDSHATRRASRAKRCALLTAILFAAPALAANATQYNAASELALAGVVAPPIVIEAGADSGPNDHVTGFALSTNRTGFSATLHGIPGAGAYVTELFRLVNEDDAAHAVTLRGDTVSHAYVERLEVRVFDNGTRIATLDFTTASPSASPGTLAAGAEWQAAIYVKLAAGAGAHNTNTPFRLHVDVDA